MTNDQKDPDRLEGSDELRLRKPISSFSMPGQQTMLIGSPDDKEDEDGEGPSFLASVYTAWESWYDLGPDELDLSPRTPAEGRVA
jgi:hypothetical protein